MRRPVLFIASALAVLAVLVACSSAAPAPTSAPPKAEPTKASAPAATVAPAATTAPTKAPAVASPVAKASWPEKGKPITMIVPFNAGGGTDVNARMLSGPMEQQLGAPVQVVNKPGAGSQLGLTELAKSKPDGYTIGFTNLPVTISFYLDADRKAAFDAKSFSLVSMFGVDSLFMAVRADSPYKTIKDLVDAAKANPEKITLGTTGPMGIEHIADVEFARAAGIKPAYVHFDGSGPAVPALLGGHIDAFPANLSTFASQFKSGEVRFLGVFAKEPDMYAPDVKTLESQGYKAYTRIDRIMSAPAGTPQDVLDTLGSSIKKSIDTDDYQKKATSMYLTRRYMTSQETAAYWMEQEKVLKELLQQIKQGA